MKIIAKICFAFCLTMFSCKTAKNNLDIRFNQISNIKVIKLPNDLMTTVGIITEDRFDEITNYKDTVIIQKSKLKLKLVKDVSFRKSIDIRTKVIITFKDNQIKKIYFDDIGTIMYNGKIYEGSKRQMKRLRGKEYEMERK